MTHTDKQAHERSCEKHGYCSTTAAIQEGECVTRALSDEKVARLGLKTLPVLVVRLRCPGVLRVGGSCDKVDHSHSRVYPSYVCGEGPHGG